MATIKLQPSGNVLIKDGKVSCGCCEVDCEMYPAALLNATINGQPNLNGYVTNDLPNAVTVNGSSFSRVGTSYGNTTNGVLFEGQNSIDTDTGIITTGVWAKYTNGVRNQRTSLIQGGVVDQFPSSLTTTYTAGSITVTVFRVQTCIWQGADGCGRLWYVIYGTQVFGAGSDVGWHLFMAIDENEICEDFQQPIAGKQGFMNSPLGFYVGNNNGTVS